VLILFFVSSLDCKTATSPDHHGWLVINARSCRKEVGDMLYFNRMALFFLQDQA
jgi:hypothetical protein